MKKILAIILVTCLGFVLMTGCSSEKATDEVKTDSEEVATENDSETVEKQVLKVAAIETAYGSEMWTKIKEDFEFKNEGVKIELIVDKNLEDAIGANMKAGEYPDVVLLATGRPAALTETLIKEEALVELTDVLEMIVPGEGITVGDKIAGGFTDSSLTNPYGDGVSYLAPMFYSPCGLFFNSALLEEKGWEVPTTWDEMWELGDKASQEGIALFAYPTAGYFDTFFYALLYEIGGSEFFNSCMNYEEGIWETAEANLAFDIVEKLATYTEATVPANANNDNYQKNQQLILDNKAIFMPNGTWVIGEMAEAPRAEGFAWGFTALPAVSEGGDRYSYTWFEQVWIPAMAENQDMAKEFIAYLYSFDAAEIFAASNAIQPIVGLSETLEGDSQLFYSVYDNGAKAALGNFAATEAVEGVNIGDTLFGTVNSLVTGDKTKAQWIEAIIKDSNALRDALK